MEKYDIATNSTTVANNDYNSDLIDISVSYMSARVTLNPGVFANPFKVEISMLLVSGISINDNNRYTYSHITHYIHNQPLTAYWIALIPIWFVLLAVPLAADSCQVCWPDFIDSRRFCWDVVYFGFYCSMIALAIDARNRTYQTNEDNNVVLLYICLFELKILIGFLWFLYFVICKKRNYVTLWQPLSLNEKVWVIIILFFGDYYSAMDTIRTIVHYPVNFDELKKYYWIVVLYSC